MVGSFLLVAYSLRIVNDCDVRLVSKLAGFHVISESILVVHNHCQHGLLSWCSSHGAVYVSCLDVGPSRLVQFQMEYQQCFDGYEFIELW